jgi:SAM-dependent methyltransferase
MLLYAYTIFTSAFLLFLVQPVIAKMILPWFGGSASVWTTCMLFFQGVLLLGYLYSHWAVRTLKPKTQLWVHVGLLALSLAALPIAPSASWKPAGAEDPTFRIWGLLSVSVGLPYFLLSTTGPLIQAWYARTHHQAVPYRLFALSNLGSMLALLGYPVVIEPFVTSRNQALFWTGGYVLFTLLCAGAAWRASRADVQESAGSSRGDAGDGRAPWTSVALWIALPACASLMLLAVTNYMCQDVASIPFLWVVPLALYLLSFILCFEREGWYRPRVYEWLLAAAIGGMCYLYYGRDSDIPLRWVIVAFSAGLFVCCMFCHGEVARRKPAVRHLTFFYLMISLGGAVGSMLVALVAPRVFRAYYELPVGLVLCAVLALIVNRRDSVIYYSLISAALVMGFYMVKQSRQMYSNNILMVRNFYGALAVAEEGSPGEPEALRKLIHGTINHGQEFLDPERRRWPTTYYAPNSGVGVAIEHNRHSGQRVGVIGLGTGTLATYGRPGDYYRFYEINPLVIDIAHSYFFFLQDSQAKVDVALGDARLSLEREPPQNFDVLAVDAFSSDSIPVHLLTLEAFQIYFRHLRPDGVLAVHVSNRYLDLKPVVRNLADRLGRSCVLIDTEDGEGDGTFGSTWVLVTSNQRFLEDPDVKAESKEVPPRPDLPLWTDDYSNLFRILK